MHLLCIMRKRIRPKKLTVAHASGYDLAMLITALLFAHLVAAKPTVGQVLDMMSDLPALEGRSDVRHVDFSNKRDAIEISKAIVEAADTWYEAQLMVVYAAYESNFVAHAVGDHGLSFGAWQLRGISTECAFIPRCAAQVWVKRARRAAVDCAQNDERERLAPLASGNCDHAKRKTRWRVELAESL
jgi:hypothetical protein